MTGHAADDDRTNGERFDDAITSLRIIGWLRSAGVVLLGISALLTASVVLSLVQVISGNAVENRCRASVSAELEVVDSDINFHGWMGILAFYEGDEEEALRRADIVEQLGTERAEAVERRARVVELCD